MNKKRLILGVALAAIVSTATLAAAQSADVPAEGAQAAEARIVTGVRGDRPLRAYEVDGASASFVGRIPREAVQLQAAVLASSPNGFVQVQTVDGPAWVKQSDVDLFPPAGPAAVVRCDSISQASDTTTGAVRGAGEGC